MAAFVEKPTKYDVKEKIFVIFDGTKLRYVLSEEDGNKLDLKPGDKVLGKLEPRDYLKREKEYQGYFKKLAEEKK